MELRAPTGDAVAREQRVYARLLQVGSIAAAVLMVVTFTLYYAEWLEPAVPLTRLHHLWSLPVADFVRESGVSPGWGWVAALPSSDVLNLAVLAALAGLSVPCLLALVPIYAALGDRLFVALVLVEAAIIGLAATGLLSGAH